MKYLVKEHKLDIEKDLAPVDRLKVFGRIKEEAEKAKMALSSAPSASISLPWLAQKNGETINLEMELARSEYESLIEVYVRQSMATVNEALQAAGISAGDIDIVLAVGGSSRTPLVLESLKKVFGNKIRGGLNPDEAVALGAAVQAGIISNEISGEGSIAIFDVCNHTLGTDVLSDDGDKLEYSRLIMRDTHLPFAMKRQYCTTSDFQRSVDVTVYQGESDDLSKNTVLGSFTVDGIPENYARKEAIDIEFVYNINGMLDVNVTIVSTGKVASQKINMLNYDAPKTKSEERMDDIINGAWTQSDEIKTLVMLYQNKRGDLPDDAKKQADKLMRQMKQAVADNDMKRIEEIDDELTVLLFEY